MEEKLAIIYKDIKSLAYYVELTRSIILEIEALMDNKQGWSAE
jgi:hypothetical protein